MYLQIQYQQIADTSDPDQASANSYPANCRCFQPRPGICKFISSKLQILPTPTRHLQVQYQQVADASNPDQASTYPIPTSCRYFRPRPDIYKSNTSKLQMLPTPTRHLQIQIQQIADTSAPDQASTNPIPTSCRCFQPRPGIYKSNSSKLQILPNPTRHLQIQFQQVADTSEPGQASTNPILANCRYFRSRPGICNSPKQQIKDAHR